MRRIIALAIGTAVVGYAAPATAQSYGYDYGNPYGYVSQHQQEHERLRQERHQVHHELDDQHLKIYAYACIIVQERAYFLAELYSSHNSTLCFCCIKALARELIYYVFT